MFFKKRKSRKQLLQEIEELKAEVIKQQSCKVETYLKLDAVQEQIVQINAACIGNSRGLNEEHTQDSIIECLCQELAQQIMPYVSYEKYRIVGEPWEETKHIATIKIVADQK